MRSLRVVLVAFVVSAALVLIALAARQEGKRTATDAYLPMRTLTIEEAAFLVRAGTAIAEIGDRDVVLATRNYVLRGDDGKLRAESATWESYCSTYRVARAPLERALGRRLLASELRPLPDPVAFSSDRVPLYVATEIAFLTAWLAGGALLLQALRRHWLAMLPVLWLLTLVPLFFVAWYSPAYVDADLFHQRVVLETIAWDVAIANCLVTIPAALSLLVWIGSAAAQRRRTRSLTGQERTSGPA